MAKGERAQPHGTAQPEATQLFRLLGDPTRLRIALLLADAGEMHGRALEGRLGLSQPLLSMHLKWLRLGGLVQYRQEGRRHYHRLATPVVANLLRLACNRAGEGK
jgi:DNA-binding transcriptional ArsR family regulator